MQWFQHLELSEFDYEMLQGSALMEKLQKHRLVIAYEPKETHATPDDMGLFNLTNVFYIREINDETYEILFAEKCDLETVENYLVQFKLKNQ